MTEHAQVVLRSVGETLSRCESNAMKFQLNRAERAGGSAASLTRSLSANSPPFRLRLSSPPCVPPSTYRPCCPLARMDVLYIHTHKTRSRKGTHPSKHANTELSLSFTGLHLLFSGTTARVCPEETGVPHRDGRVRREKRRLETIFEVLLHFTNLLYSSSSVDCYGTQTLYSAIFRSLQFNAQVKFDLN